MEVGFIGVGVMGGQMVKNLLAKGYSVLAYDLNPDALEKVAGYGARVASSIESVCAQQSVILMSLPDPAACEQVMLGPGGVLASPRQPDLLAIDLSTSLPSVARKIRAAADEAGVAYLDCPVSGGPEKSVAGTLTMMVGGDEEVFERAKPIFEDMGKLIVHLGPTGMGCAAKLVNNMISITNTSTMMEGIVLGFKAGLDPKKMFEIVRNSSGNSYQWEKKGPRVLRRDFRPLFSMFLEYKDIALATRMAEEMGVPVPTAETARQMFGMGKQMGLGPEDNTALIKLYEMFARVEVQAPDSQA